MAAAWHRKTSLLLMAVSLGPTTDDLILAAVARGLDRQLVLHQEARTMIIDTPHLTLNLPLRCKDKLKGQKDLAESVATLLSWLEKTSNKRLVISESQGTFCYRQRSHLHGNALDYFFY